MASFDKLVDLTHKGDLGNMLALKFHGEKLELNPPRKDLELAISFAKSETPSIEEIRQAVMEYYTQLGFNVEASKQPRPMEDMFQLVVFGDRKVNGLIEVLVTVNDGGQNRLQIDTSVCC